MAETVHLVLKANGTEIKGESSQVSQGRQDTIECIFFDHTVTTPRDTASGMSTGKRQYSPIFIRKCIDKSTPLLFKAFTENQIVDAVFRFFRPDAVGDGTTEQFYTIEIAKGRISSIRNYLPDTLTPDTARLPPLEELSFVFHTIKWTYTDGGITHEDTWNVR